MAKILMVFIFINNLIEFSKLGVAVEGSSGSLLSVQTPDCSWPDPPSQFLGPMIVTRKSNLDLFK